jgi:N-acetylglucosaminyl-diphospho-decaprenol L-rhamnosyltransferase
VTDITRTATVVLVNYRSLDGVERLLSLGILARHDVIIVDNNDEPDRVRELCATHNATPVLLDTNVGFAAGVNRAVAKVEMPEQPWLLLNPDITATADEIDRLINRVDEGLDGCAPLLRLSNGRQQAGVGGGPLTLWSVAAYFLFVSHLIPAIRGIFLTRTQARKGGSASWLCMACLALKPDVFVRFGPIPEDEIVYGEDIAWGTLASALGARFAVEPKIVVTHDQGSSGGSAAWIGALERLCRKRLGTVRGLLAVSTIRVGLDLRRLCGRPVA